MGEIKDFRRERLKNQLDVFKRKTPPVKANFELLKKRKEGRQLEPYKFSKNNYTNINAGVLNKIRESRSLQNPFSLLLYLLQWKGYKTHTGEYKRGLCGKWYKNGFIISSQSEEQMAINFGVSERTIRNWLNMLIEDKLIMKIKDGLFNIYVVGLLGEDDSELYFYCGDIVIPERSCR